VATVREAVQGDARGVEALWAAVAAEGEWIGAELPLRSDWGDRFRDAIDAPEMAWFVVEVEGDIVGGLFVRHERGIAHLGMAVLEGRRGVGIGRLLLNAALDWARARGCHKVTLEVWPHNARARRLYESAGFIDEGYLTRHYRRKSGALWDAVAMGLVLDTDSPGRP
jgi:ribosomal protein S18 acetylase RimI-like enzyme